MVTKTEFAPRSVRTGVVWNVVFGVVLAPVTLLLAGAVTAIFMRDGSHWLGVFLAALVAAGTILVARWSPTTGLIAGVVLAVLMLLFAISGAVPSSRPQLDFAGVVVLGGSGLLSAALVAAYVTTGIITRRGSGGIR